MKALHLLIKPTDEAVIKPNHMQRFLESKAAHGSFTSYL